MSFSRSHPTAAPETPIAFGPISLRARSVAFSLLLLLAVQFLLGMVTNLFTAIPANHPGSGAANYFSGVAQGLGWAIIHGGWSLQLHVGLGVGLILTSLFLIGVAYRSHERVWMICAPIGAVGMLGAGFNGASFINYGHDFSSLLMSVGFLIALVSLLIGLYLSPRALS